MTSTTARNPMAGRPGLSDVAETLRVHHAYWSRMTGVNANMQEGTEDKVTQQYAGRTPFELLQNALDRCHASVWMEVVYSGEQGALLVGNDGQGVSVSPQFKPELDISENKRLGFHSDFHALCGVNLSNKNPDEATGNKGVGFRSVFELGESAQVWSRLAGEDGWWGVELHHPMTREAWDRGLGSPEVARGMADLLAGVEPWVKAGQTLPSFFAPLPLRSDHPPEGTPPEVRDDTATVVVVPFEGRAARASLERGLDALASRHLEFVGLREGRRSVAVTLPGGRGVLRTWPTAESGSLLIRHDFGDDIALAGLARKAGLAATRISVAVRWGGVAPMLDAADGPNEGTRVYCYLPTQVRGAFGADVHGDFQLGIDRKVLNVEDGAQRDYHKPLLRAVGQLQVTMALHACGLRSEEVAAWPGLDPKVCGRVEAGSYGVRADVWRFLCPAVTDLKPLRERVEESIFGPAATRQTPAFWQPWGRLAAAFFGTPEAERPRRSRQAHEDFWRATHAWLRHWQDQHRNPRTRTQRNREDLRSLLTALHQSRALAVPVLQGDEEPGDTCAATRVPVWREQGGLQTAADQVLYIRQPVDGDRMPPLPESLRSQGVVVTTWEPGEGFRVDDLRLPGAGNFTPPELLGELRQLPRRHDRSWTPDGRIAGTMSDEEAAETQALLLEYAAKLFRTRYGQAGAACLADQPDVQALGWRSFPRVGATNESAGRAVSTLFFQMEDRRWVPARQVRRNELAPGLVDRLLRALGSAEVLERFFRFVGITRAGGLLVVEGGAEGVVEPVLAPPPLVPRSSTSERAVRLVLAVEDPSRGCSSEDILAAWGADTDPGDIRALTQPDLQAADPVRGAGCAVLYQLRREAWLRVEDGRVEPPTEMIVAESHICPIGLLLTAGSTGLRRIRRALWSWHEPVAPELLERVGAVWVDRDIPPDSARFWLQTLRRRRGPALATLGPIDRAALTEAYQIVLRVLASCSGDFDEVLAYEPQPPRRDGSLGASLGQRALAWCDPDEVWVAPDSHSQGTLARYFPGLHLLAGTCSEKQTREGPLNGRAIAFQSRVVAQDQATAQDRVSQNVAERLDDALAYLLLLADLSPQLNRPVSSVEDLAGKRDRLLHGYLRRSRDVYVEHFLTTGPTLVPGLPWRKDAYDDVFVQRNSAKSEPTIWFDCELPDTPPPLRNFGESLSKFMELGEVADAWSLALAEVDVAEDGETARSRLEALVVRRGGNPGALAHYRRLLRPLTDRQLAAVDLAVRTGLAAVGLRATVTVARGVTTIRQQDVAPLDDGRTVNPSEAEVKSAILDHLDDAGLAGSLPGVDFVSANETAWDVWLGTGRISRRARILRWVQVQREEDGTETRSELDSVRAHSLSDAHHPGSQRFVFDMEGVTRTWMDAQVADLGMVSPPGPIDGFLPEIRRYEEVRLAPLALRTDPLPVALPKGVGGGQRPQTPEDRESERIVTAERGEDAETAFLAWVYKGTREILARQSSGWVALLDACSSSIGQRKVMEEARMRGNVDPGDLRVSTRWGDAGFDILGLELAHGVPVAARYEVKGLPSGGPRVRFFLSRNEHGVARRNKAENSIWRLIGVREDGSAIDLTPAVEELLDKEHTLADLGASGIAADGFVVYRTLPVLQ